jgi:TetR/AcrR family transcriptional regulator, mexJK operon transcriptional repressor
VSGRGAPTVPPRRGGRPSREEAALLGERILDVATELFFTEGYGAASIEAVAQRAGISKRTFYHRFPDKAALFAAVVHRIIQALRPPPGAPLYEGDSLDEILRHLARLILRAGLAPPALALSRLMVAEAQRFPELAAIAREGSRAEVVGRMPCSTAKRTPAAYRSTAPNSPPTSSSRLSSPRRSDAPSASAGR